MTDEPKRPPIDESDVRTLALETGATIDQIRKIADLLFVKLET